jgi:beta-galactosidase/beta-glucuronidase
MNHHLRIATLLISGLLPLASAGETTSVKQGSKMVKTPELSSRWQEELLSATPLPEYPRPTMVREKWLNLNGQWDFLHQGPRPPQQPESFTDTAHVPSAMQAATSCVTKGGGGGGYGWYRKTVTIPAEWAGSKVVFHGEAIGTKSTIFFDGKELGSHVGGFKRITHELPGATAGQDHEIVVFFDDTDKRMSRGKSGALAGMWQTAWIEAVPQDYITSYQQTPDIDQSCLTLKVNATDPALTVSATALDQGKPVATAQGDARSPFQLEIPNQKLWSPESPFLYDLVLELKRDGKTIDRVKGYFGMRKISTGEVDGQPRIFLNNEVYYQVGLLDQGSWPDSFFTQPSDKCLEFEVQTAKDMGFNVIRKHFKVAAERWYHWCDKIGMLVWQDAPRQILFISDLHKTEEDKQPQREVVRDMVTQRYNHPSIITWVLFNEGGAQFDPKGMTEMTRKLDSSRLINATSHVHERFVKMGRRRYEVDFHDTHCYDRTLKLEDYDSHIPATFGEYGGIGYEIKEHSVQNEKNNWGYGEMVFSADELLSEYEKLVQQAVAMRKTDNVCALIYTELTDFHNEVNGFITFDRKVIKVDPEKMREINMQFRHVEAKD